MAETDRDDLNLVEAFELARECLKSLLTLNGGAAVAILAFYGQALTKDGIVTDVVRGHISSALLLFSLGAFDIAVTFVAAYITELLWGGSYKSEARQKTAHRFASWFHRLALALTVTGAGFFVAGVYETRQAIASPLTRPPHLQAMAKAPVAAISAAQQPCP